MKALLDQSKEVIKDRLDLELLSRLYGVPIFKQKKERITLEDLEEIQDELLRRGIFSNIETSPNYYYLKILKPYPPRRKPRFWLHLVLFLLTVVTTSMTGAMLRGHDPFASWADFSTGFSYSFALLAILFSHEMGHYLAARYYRIDVTLPYFIPLFLPAFHPGTLGAFIKMRSPMPHRKALFDVGVAGPLAGFVVSLIFLTIGFSRLPDTNGIYAYISQIHPLDDPHGINLVLGNTLLYDWLGAFFGASRLPMNEMYHFPFIFAAWFGLLVTAINLMPIGQLDGGHITYAMFGDRARFIALGAFALLIVLNVYLISNFNSYIWVLWSILILVFIRFRHPPTLDDSIILDKKRRILGWISYIIFVLCFSPMPFYVTNM
ncbi:site-2 protease family protein [Calditrichota bacterium GD2]